MSDIILLSGSPSLASRSTAVLTYIEELISREEISASSLSLRDLPAEELLYGYYDSPAIQEAAERITKAKAVVIATPVYKAAYTGFLKIFLDLLPRDALQDKIVLPIAVGGTLAHLLTIDYALKPVLNALGARYIYSGVYILDSQIERSGLHLRIEDDIKHRIHKAVQQLIFEYKQQHHPIFQKGGES
ncbi:NADPH-dependent FMN reductase [Aneurinibacillus tyrosinisolvens]|uniref:NADPH-dependent FMN reductase n=1 Tax=Aneurinibacillus tyrosinisolvens TaxID=1443435 RepID=UPI00063F8963|nr:NADPH-dependent FMN reductase [Aneurinibacillus tyrosinisolvens]